MGVPAAFEGRGASVGNGLEIRIAPGTRPDRVQWEVVPRDGSAMSAERAGRVEVLAGTDLAGSLADWPVAEGVRVLVDGRLRWEHAPAMPMAFFVAREAAPPPPTVDVRDVAGLRAAATAAVPGTRIRLAPGNYPGGVTLANVRGAPGLPVVFAALDPADPPVFRGGTSGWQVSDPEHLVIEDIVFTGASGNGLNIDDAGSFGTPARGVVLRRLRVTDVGPTGNRDGIKLSGVDEFRVEHCVIERWGTGGSGIDMVGCHDGVIEGNTLRHLPSTAAETANGVQAKGGCRNVAILRNRFEHAGSRSVNLGGSTGLTLFRPPLQDGGEHWEARDLKVEGNTFIGSGAPFACVGVDGADVRFNTVYQPGRWFLRILQETTAAGFVPCRNGRFTDNLVAFHSGQWASGGVNVGPNTAPQTFVFGRNWWYCVDQPARSRPTLPVAETGGTYGVSPQFRDAAAGDVSVAPGSPAAHVGAHAYRGGG